MYGLCINVMTILHNCCIIFLHKLCSIESTLLSSQIIAFLPLKFFLPKTTDVEKLLREFAVLVARYVILLPIILMLNLCRILVQSMDQFN